MTLLLILTVLSLVAIAATVHDLRTDRDGRRRPPGSHHEDPTFRSPTAHP